MAKQAAQTTEDVPDQRDLWTLVDKVEPLLEWAERDCRALQWERYLQEDARDPTDCEDRRAALLLDEDTWLTVMRWAPALSVTDPVQRRLVLLGRKLIPATAECKSDIRQLRHQLETKFLADPPRLRTSRRSWGYFVATLHTHPDRGRRERAWQAQVPVAKRLRNSFLELVRLRNHWAQQQGYDTYIDLALAPQGLSRDSILEQYVDLEEVTLGAYKALLRRMRDWLPFNQPANWDITYFQQAWMTSSSGQPIPFNGSSPDVVALIKALGIPWESFHFAPELTDRLPYPCLCMPVHVPDDVRLSISPQQGWESYIETARAFGQAILSGCTEQPSYLLRESAPCYEAGMGAFLARVAADPVWLRKRGILPDSMWRRVTEASFDMVVLRLRRLMALSVFEFQVYETPDADLDGIWGDIQEAFLFLPNTPWAGWVVQPDYIFRPIHLQNEVIGELIASQAVNYLHQRFGPLFDNPELTEFLLEAFYSNGAAQDWVDQVRTASGKFLSHKALFGELLGEE